MSMSNPAKRPRSTKLSSSQACITVSKYWCDCEDGCHVLCFFALVVPFPARPSVVKCWPERCRAACPRLARASSPCASLSACPSSSAFFDVRRCALYSCDVCRHTWWGAHNRRSVLCPLLYVPMRRAVLMCGSPAVPFASPSLRVPFVLLSGCPSMASWVPVAILSG